MRMHLLISFFLLCLTQQAYAGTLSLVERDTWVTVAKIYDGDTFKTTKGEKVRLLGINTPETMHGTEPGQPFGSQAKKILKSLIMGKTVRLKTDKEERDMYGRLLAHVYLRDGRWINGLMIQEGLAHVYTFAPNIRFSRSLLKIEQQARKQQLGIWAHKRFKVLTSKNIRFSHIGQFRLVQGKVTSINKKRWGFKMGKLNISIPRKYRKWFKKPPKLKIGQHVITHGKIRVSSKGKLFLALHTPADLEFITGRFQVPSATYL